MKNPLGRLGYKNFHGNFIGELIVSQMPIFSRNELE